jgi:phosphoglycerate dehydrogenase-like enzyme
MNTTNRKLLHIAHRQPSPRLWTNTFRTALKPFGDLEVIANGADMTEAGYLEKVRSADILLTGWGAMPVPATIATEPGKIKYICHLTGEMRHTVPLEIIRSKIPVTNWGDSPSFEVAEGAMVLLLAMAKNLRGFIVEKEAGHWHDASPGAAMQTATLRGLKIGLYGLGFIGRTFLELLRPFRPAIRAFDPYAVNWPEGVERVASLEELFKDSHAVVIHAGLTPETQNSVNAKLLSLLPDKGILINTARGGIVDQEALFAELATGRLRAALDVLAGDDRLPPDHPARKWPNLIITSHQISNANWPIHPEDPDAPLLALHEMALGNLQRFYDNQPLQFVIDEKRYSLMS